MIREIKKTGATKTKKKLPSTINYTDGKQYKVKLKGKLGKDNYSLFLEIYRGTKTVDGKKKPVIERHYLKKHIHSNPRTPIEKAENNETLRVAEKLRQEYEDKLMYIENGMVNPKLKDGNFIDYFDNYIKNYKKKDKAVLVCVLKAFVKHIDTTYIKATMVDKKVIKDFADYLQEKYKPETAVGYMGRMKKVLLQAVDDGLFLKSPAHKINCKGDESVKKYILSENDLRKLFNTHCVSPEVKRAFLFSCFSGLRFSDLKTLKKTDVANKKATTIQEKTLKTVTIDLNPSALYILGMSDNDCDGDLVFKLPTYSTALRSLKSWTKKAGIKNNITWHCGRHTFATTLLTTGTDIRTVADLMGHSNIRHTVKYLHLVDEKKTEAVNRLPNIKMDKDIK